MPYDWDEDARPVGPAPEPGQVYSSQGRAVAGHLVEIHDHLRGELARVRDLVEEVRSGRVAAAEARATVSSLTMSRHDWRLGAYCASFCQFVAGHHGLEDAAVFPYLASADVRLTPVVERLKQEHVVVHELLVTLDAVLVEILNGQRSDPSGFDGTELLANLADTLERLGDALLSHLAYEERELLEPLARLGFFAGQV